MRRATIVPLLVLLAAAGCESSRPAERQLPTAPAAVSEARFSGAAAARGPAPVEVTLCHKPGTPAQQTLTMPEPAVSAHLRHGDRLGGCDLPPPGATACPVARVVTGSEGPQATLTFQDTGPGLLYLSVVQSLSTNANVTIPSFDPATSDPIIVTATRIDPAAQQATFVIMVRIDTESTSSGRPCSYAL